MWDSESADEKPVQALQFELLRYAGRHFRRVVKDLRANRALWDAAMAGPYPQGLWSLIALRDLPKGRWNVDHLYVLSSGRDDEALERLADYWSADEVRWAEGEEAADLLGFYSPKGPPRILVVWWD